MPDILILQASSRAKGNTHKLITSLFDSVQYDLIDLNAVHVTYYDYEHKNKDDDFLKIINNMSQYKTVIFASPVYANGISGQLKTFFDRTTDLLDIDTALLKKLKQCSFYLITCGQNPAPVGLEVSVAETCKYLNLNYQKMFFFHLNNDGTLTDLNQLHDVSNELAAI